jgi:hypothetical protein
MSASKPKPRAKAKPKPRAKPKREAEGEGRRAAAAESAAQAKRRERAEYPPGLHPPERVKAQWARRGRAIGERGYSAAVGGVLEADRPGAQGAGDLA